MYRGDEICMRILKGRGNSEDLGVDGRIILNVCYGHVVRRSGLVFI
jgi:hypothetical protein